MISILKTVLDSWDADIRSAEEMTLNLTQMGLPDEYLPSRHAISAGCLALQTPEAISRLRESLIPSEQELLEQGVLHANWKINNMKGGALLVLHHALDKLPVIFEQFDAMLERASSFTQPDAPVAGHPVIRIGTDRVEGHKHQFANIHVRLKDVDRLLIFAERQESQRVLLFPPEMVRVTLPIIEGELLLYAENTLGASISRMLFNEVKYV